MSTFDTLTLLIDEIFRTLVIEGNHPIRLILDKASYKELETGFKNVFGGNDEFTIKELCFPNVGYLPITVIDTDERIISFVVK